MLHGQWLALMITATAAVAAAYEYHRRISQLHKQQIQDLEAQLEKQKQLRAQERQGRTNAEREAREAIQRHQEASGYTFEAIAHVESCFVDRRGTPRQGALVPDARARIRFRTSIPPSSLECVQDFSHLWVLFVFHENTNLAKAATEKKSTYPAKIAPPRLGGKKVGLFSTRTPHRPNSIGLTVVKVDAIYDRVIEISGHDLVHGTPVLDVKPYVPADRIMDPICPSWVEETSDITQRPVVFADAAICGLEEAISCQQVQFYRSTEALMRAITQMLVLDIRSVHQMRGKATNDTQVFHCRFDRLSIEFQTLEDHIFVVQATRS